MRKIDISIYSNYIINFRRINNDKIVFENLISFLIQQNLFQSIEYKRLYTEYIDYLNDIYYIQYQIFIDSVIMNYMTPTEKKYWEIDYENQELIIYD